MPLVVCRGEIATLTFRCLYGTFWYSHTIEREEGLEMCVYKQSIVVPRRMLITAHPFGMIVQYNLRPCVPLSGLVSISVERLGR